MTNSTDKTFFLRGDDSVYLKTPIRQRFNVLLNRIGRSQNWLADEVGINRGTMSKIANGDWFPCSETMKRISEILQCDSVVIFGDSIHWKKWSDKVIYNNKVTQTSEISDRATSESEEINNG
jgi:DNA-binding XRE family transcriptional regulator